jgi:protein-disulfide isomerase
MIFRRNKEKAMTKLRVPVTPDDHIRGRQDAPITLVEYGDYECPHCGRAYYILQEIEERYKDELRFVFRHFPLAQIHPFAEPAAESAEFAATHDLFWEMHDGIYENQRELGLPLLFRVADSLDLPAVGLQQALESHQYLPQVQEDFLGGVKSGVNGTPTFFINGVRHNGTYEFDDLVSAIDSRLNELKSAA